MPAGAEVFHEPPDPADNRWQRGSVVEAPDFADSEETTWAEWYRYLAEAGLPPHQALPRDLWRWEISLPNVADLSDNDRLARVGLPALQPTRHQWPAFQTIGEQIHAEQWPALLSASAARPTAQVLCVFRTAPQVPGTTPLAPPTTITEPPVVPTGMRTECPADGRPSGSAQYVQKIDMPTPFADFNSELNAEANAEGLDALVELQALRLPFSLARQLAARRRERRLTQEQFAQLSGVPQSSIGRIERGQADPPTATLAALTRALEVDVQLVER